MDAWPLTLPQAPDHEFQGEIAAGLSAAADELSQRRTRTYPEIEATFVFRKCTAAQLQALRTFYDDTLNQTKPFTAPWLVDAGFAHHFCQFSDMPSAVRSGLKFDISVPLTIISSVPVNGLGEIVYGSVD